MRLVVDTNVFVSATLRDTSLPASVVRWIDHHGGFLKSTETERELLLVFERPKIAAVTRPTFLDGLRKLLARAELVEIAERITASRDPKTTSSWNWQ